MNNKISSILIISIALTMIITPLMPIVQTKKVTVTDMGYYTEYVGELGGAGFAFFKPKSWNGRLIVVCHFFMNEAIWTNDPKSGPFGMVYVNMAKMYTGLGYALAYSTYGEPGYCIRKGMIRTHQLTEWVIENHDVTGEVFLSGYSMGFISVLLAAKYPDLYDGVFDVVGPKDLKTRYNSWIGLPDTAGILPALEAECGGTPETKPKAYERRSPTYNADLKVKTISLYGEDDVNVPPIHAEMFYDAVEAAGSLDYYRGYVYEDFGHGTFAQNQQLMLAHFMDLVNWVVNDIEPPADPYPVP